jgi:cytidyltransferase-like protein
LKQRSAFPTTSDWECDGHNRTTRAALPNPQHTSKAGKKVVFTNGTFDILHRGHVEYLAKAKALGDVLVVGLNTDASIRRIKGRHRPINPNRDRAAVLAALFLYHFFVLPHPPEDGPAFRDPSTSLALEFFRIFGLFFKKKGILTILAFFGNTKGTPLPIKPKIS